jgi:hypothetical protein
MGREGRGRQEGRGKEREEEDIRPFLAVVTILWYYASITLNCTCSSVATRKLIRRATFRSNFFQRISSHAVSSLSCLVLSLPTPTDENDPDHLITSPGRHNWLMLMAV